MVLGISRKPKYFSKENTFLEKNSNKILKKDTHELMIVIYQIYHNIKYPNLMIKK